MSTALDIDVSLFQPEAGSVSENARAGTQSGDEASYWKKPATDPSEPSFVTVMQIGKNTMERFYTGWQPLVQKYGGFNLAQGKGSKNEPAWNVEMDPFLRIVAMPGGLAEFPAEQVLKLNWHRRPRRQDYRSHHLVWVQVERYIQAGLSEDSAVRAVFPQLGDRELLTFTCEFCPGRTFNEENHLRRHEVVQHKNEVQSRETRNSIAIALRDGQVGGGGQLTELMVQLMGKISEGNTETQAALLAFMKTQIGAEPPVSTQPTAEVSLSDTRAEVEAEHKTEGRDPAPTKKHDPRAAFNETIGLGE